MVVVATCSKAGCTQPGKFLVNETWLVCGQHLQEVAAIFRTVADKRGPVLMRIRVREVEQDSEGGRQRESAE